jgi:transcription elongation factor SPT6
LPPLEKPGYGNKNKTLYDIRAELSKRYEDRREPYQPLDAEQLFYALIHETPRTFHAGKLVLARVLGIARKKPTAKELEESNPVRDEATLLWQCAFCRRNDFHEIGQVWAHFDTSECAGHAVGVRTLLDNGCGGFLPLKCLSDSNVTNPDERIKQVIRAASLQLAFEQRK